MWHVPRCPPVPPATWVASIILTDLRSGSHLYLNGDGSVRDSPSPDYELVSKVVEIASRGLAHQAATALLYAHRQLG